MADILEELATTSFDGATANLDLISNAKLGIFNEEMINFQSDPPNAATSLLDRFDKTFLTALQTRNHDLSRLVMQAKQRKGER